MQVQKTSSGTLFLLSGQESCEKDNQIQTLTCLLYLHFNTPLMETDYTICPFGRPGKSEAPDIFIRVFILRSAWSVNRGQEVQSVSTSQHWEQKSNLTSNRQTCACIMCMTGRKKKRDFQQSDVSEYDRVDNGSREGCAPLFLQAFLISKARAL